MLRSTRKHSTEDDDYDSSEIKGYGKKRGGGSSSSNSTPNEPLVPIPMLVGIVIICIFLGFSVEHYKRTRGVDPFNGKIMGIDYKISTSSSLSSLKSKSLSSLSLLESSKSKLSSKRSVLSPEEDASLEYDNNERYHLIFSTDCSPYQHWQSYLVYYTAMMVKQPGHVTRIASGCNEGEAQAIRTWFNDNIQFMSNRFHLHLTPHFSEVKDENGNIIGDYKFFNKPFGLKYWLENFDLLSFNKQTQVHKHEDDIVILIDPDMALLKPITSDFSSNEEVLIGPRRQNHIVSRKVKHGTPFAQAYGLGTQWETFDLNKIAGPNSPAKDVSKEDGFLYYPSGPPYIGTVRDMYQIATKWSEFVPKVHAQYPHLLAEMYAYCIASAHLNLKHQLIDSLMISNTNTGGEGWPLIHKIPSNEMCEFGKTPDNNKYSLPSVVHLCQRYAVGKDWFFGKRKIPHDIYDCDSPLFIEPPNDLATLYDYKQPPNQNSGPTKLTPKLVNEESFMVCYLTRLLNDAATFYKSNACPSGTANLEKTRTVADLFREHNKK